MAQRQIPAVLNGPIVASDTAATQSTLVERDGVGDIYGNVLRAAGGVRSSGCSYGGIVAKTSTVAVDDSMETILCDATGGSFPVNLPAASTCAGKELDVKKTTSPNTVTITGNGAELIDGANTLALTTQYSSRRIKSDGTKWHVIASV